SHGYGSYTRPGVWLHIFRSRAATSSRTLARGISRKADHFRSSQGGYRAPPPYCAFPGGGSMTDATGRSFLSYRRTRANEAALLISAQHDHGIPTWQDQKDLAETPIADELHRILNDRFTANAVLWMTPD